MVDTYTKQIVPAAQHRLVINNREAVDITGVVHVESFDDEEIVLETEKGLPSMERICILRI